MNDNILLIFEQNCKETKPGDELYVTGERNELGNWNENNNNKLFTNKETFPLWKSNPISIPYQNKLSFEYKYFLKRKNGEKIWEKFKGNRKIEISDLKCCTYIIKDEKFNDKSKSAEIIVESYDAEKENNNLNNEDNKNNESEKENNNVNNEENKNNESEKENNNLNNEKYQSNSNENESDAKKEDQKYNETKEEEPISEIIDDTKEEEKTTEYKKEMNLLKECKTGLNNIGATCYMNSTLQCFCHIKEFINYFKGNSEQLNNEETLAYSFKLLIDELWPDDPNDTKKFYAPNDMKEKISKMNPLFEGIAACDAKDLVNFIIMKLHEELNKVKNHPKINNDIFLDQTNPQVVFDCYMKDFANSNQSIISDLFYGTNKNITQCNYCKYTVYNYQIFFFLNFPLEEVRKFKIQQNNNFNNNNIYINYNNTFSNNNYNMYFNNTIMNNNFINNTYMNNNTMNNNFINNNTMNNNFINNNTMNNNFINNNFINNNCINSNCNNNSLNEVNIYDCFDYDKKINYMSGENKMFCNQCKINQDCLMKTELVIG